MDRHGINDAWATEEAPAAPPLTDSSDSLPEATQPHSPPKVLGRIPDVDATTSGNRSRKKSRRSDGRLISQALSTKLLLGGGALLVLAAIVPLLLGKSQPKGGKPPAPNAQPAPAFDAAVVQTPIAPATTSGARQAPPELDFAPHIPTGPEFTLAVPNSPLQTADQSPSNTDHPPSDVDRYRVRRPDPGYGRQYQPPQDPQDQPQARLNRKMKLGDCVPGVARLEGIIVKPPVRTTYDRARSSIH